MLKFQNTYGYIYIVDNRLYLSKYFVELEVNKSLHPSVGWKEACWT